jgi:hypothetical protein
MATATVVGSRTLQLLQKAHTQLDALGHRIAAAEIREAQERKDAQARADAAAYLTSREHMLDRQSVMRQYQARADDALQPWGERAPAPVADESVDEYRVRLVKIVQKRLPEGDEYREMPMRRTQRQSPDAFKNFEDAIYPRARAAAERLDSVAQGEERAITHVDPINGHKSVTFLRRDSFVTDFKAPIRYVRGFFTKNGYYNTAGRYLHEK